ncbi:hypothetical protein D3C85_1765270 [compost metagenome]
MYSIAALEAVVKQRPHAFVEVVTDVFHVVWQIFVIQLYAALEQRAVQHAALIPRVIQPGTKGVFVKVIGALAVDVAFARFQRRLHHPHPM